MVTFRQEIGGLTEIIDLAIADLVLTAAFALIYAGGLKGAIADPSLFLYLLPIAFIGSSLSFILHEYMHKVVAMKFGAIAAFKRWNLGLGLTIVSGLIGFLIGLPGATMIYTNRFTEREEGLVSLAGPLTNFLVFFVFLGISVFFAGYLHAHSYVADIVAFTMEICIWLAFFNMLPLYPLDGSKVLRWNKIVYVLTVFAIFGFMYYFIGPIALSYLILALFMAVMFSFMYRGMRTF